MCVRVDRMDRRPQIVQIVLSRTHLINWRGKQTPHDDEK